jgi:SCY1-like protein 1
MTERVRPLSAVLPQYSNKTAQVKEDWLLWGMQRISVRLSSPAAKLSDWAPPRNQVALAFINEQCLSTHGNVSVNSIFISPSGEWKLGGFELFSNPKDNDAVLYVGKKGALSTFTKTHADFGWFTTWPISICLPWGKEVRMVFLKGVCEVCHCRVSQFDWKTFLRVNVSAADAYALGLLLHAVFNPSHPPPPTAEPPHPAPAPSSRGSIPHTVFNPFKKLLNPNPKGRFNAKGFLEVGMMEGGFFSSNRLVRVCSSLDNFALASEVDKAILLK